MASWLRRFVGRFAVRQTDIDAAAALLLENRVSPGAFDSLPEPLRPHGAAEGYAIQAALARHLEAAGLGPVAGCKVGCTTAVMQAFLKIDSPCAGTMHAAGLHSSGARLRHADYHHVGVECEIAVRLAADLPTAPASRDAVAACVGACMAAIEVVDDRYRDFRALDVGTLIADDFFHAGCVLGPEVTDWHDQDLAAATGGMTIDGEAVGGGRGGDILGHPLEALLWLARAQEAQSRRLKAGQIVMLGSVVETKWVPAGGTVEVEVAGLGRAAVVFE